MAKKQETDNVTKVDLSAKKETDDNVIIEWDQIPQAPINESKKAVIKANFIPTVIYPKATNTPIVYHHGIWVRKISNGRSKLR